MRNWFKRKKRLPEPSGYVIDMNRPFWGHSFSMSDGPNDKGEWSAAIWNGQGAKVGDEFLYETAAGEVRSIITESRSAPSVWDMYFIKATITHLNDNPVGV